MVNFYESLREYGIEEKIIDKVSDKLEIYDDDEVEEVNMEDVYVRNTMSSKCYVFDNYVIGLFVSLNSFLSQLGVSYKLVLDYGNIMVYEVDEIEELPLVKNN
jgi:hypothetical protein